MLTQAVPILFYLNIPVVLIDLIDVDDSWADSDVAHMRRGAHKCSLQTNLRSACYQNLRWKSQRIKFHRLGYRFSVDLLIHTVGYSFLFGNQKHLAKVSGLLVCGFFLDILKSIGWYGFSYGFLVVLIVFHQCFSLKVITNLKIQRLFGKKSEKGKQTHPSPKKRNL